MKVRMTRSMTHLPAKDPGRQGVDCGGRIRVVKVVSTLEYVRYHLPSPCDPVFSKFLRVPCPRR